MNVSPTPFMFDYDGDHNAAETFTVTGHSGHSYIEEVREITTTLPADFYAQGKRKVSLVSWLPWPGSSVEFTPDEEFTFYSTVQDVERLPSMTTFHGHLMLAPTVKVEYLSRGRKHLQLKLTFVRRIWSEELQMVVEEAWLTVPAVQGDNNHIHLLEELPGETELDMDFALFFTETEEDIERDFETRMNTAYGDILMELL